MWGWKETPSYGFKVPFWNNELLWKSFETPWVFIGEVFYNRTKRQCVWNWMRVCVCERVPVLLQINLPPCVQTYKCEEPSPFAASEDCLHMLFFNWIMLVLWVLPFKHRCEEPLVHFVRNLLLMINKNLSDCNPAGVTHQMPFVRHCISLPCVLDSAPCVEGASLRERWQRWTLSTMGEGSCHRTCSWTDSPWISLRVSLTCLLGETRKCRCLL